MNILTPDAHLPSHTPYSEPVIGFNAKGEATEGPIRWDYTNAGWIPAEMIYRSTPADYPILTTIVRWEPVEKCSREQYSGAQHA